MRNNPILITIGKNNYIGFIDGFMELKEKTYFELSCVVPDTPALKCREFYEVMRELGKTPKQFPMGRVVIYKNRDGYDAL